MIKGPEDGYRYLRQDLPNLQDRRDYCQQILNKSVKASK